MRQPLEEAARFLRRLSVTGAPSAVTTALGSHGGFDFGEAGRGCGGNLEPGGDFPGSGGFWVSPTFVIVILVGSFCRCS
jgi:hypothetical protein